MRILGTIIIALVCLFLPAKVKAQLFLEEGKVVLTVAGGDRINKFLMVSNTSSEEVKVKIYWEDFQYLAPYDGTKKFYPAGVGPASVSAWVNFSPNEITLPPFGKQRIDYNIAVPAGIDSGHYGVLFFERTGVNIKDVSGLDIITRVGCLFFIEPKNAVLKASIENVEYQGTTIKGNFVNQSTVTVLPRIVYYIMDEGGLIKDRGELKNMYIPALETASWELPLPSELGPGQYAIVMNADLGQETVMTTELSIQKDQFNEVKIIDASR